MTSKPPPRRAAAIFAVPALTGAISLAGLIAALTGDGWRDALSWAALIVPLAAFGWAFARRH